MKRLLVGVGLGAIGVWLVYEAHRAQQAIDQYGSVVNPYELKVDQESVTLQLWLGLAALALALVLVILLVGAVKA